MKLFVYHAEHRCEPCRDMHARVDTALQNFASSTGLDGSAFIEYVDIDAHPELAPDDLTVVPHLVCKGQNGTYLNSAGRVPTSVIEGLLVASQKHIDYPEAGSVESIEEFSPDAPSGAPVFYRTYSRRNDDGSRESYSQMVDRVITDIVDLGELSEEDDALVREMAEQQHVLPSGRWLWVGGTSWIRSSKNFSGSYNCTNTTVNSPEAFGLMMELAMMGSGTGAILEKDQIAKLPRVLRKINISGISELGTHYKEGRHDNTVFDWTEGSHGKCSTDLLIFVGDSRQGWCDAYQMLIDLAFSKGRTLNIHIDLSHVRPAGSPLKGFGGTANPIKLLTLFEKVASLLSNAKGRKLTAIECCLLIDEAAACVVAGNIRRSAGMRQFSSDDSEAATAKLGLYSQDSEGNWRVDPVKENLRMANHTRCFHYKPTLQEVTDAVTLQCQSGEGAIQYVPEAIARSNHDLLPDRETKNLFISTYENEGKEAARDFLSQLSQRHQGDELVHGVSDCDPRELDHRMMRYGLNPCGDILGDDFPCKLREIHVNTIDPHDHEMQADAFRAGALEVAALLFHQFKDERYSYSREIDPIVGVSFTGLFDFFVKAFGADWLEWMFAGRPRQDGPIHYEALEASYLHSWRQEVEITIREFCQVRGLRVPNRMTTVQPAGTKSLLTGASSGWHPPKAQRFIRRITFGAYDPVALAAIDAGYSVIPAPSARDEEGNLLNDIHDPRSAEWLVEIPTEVPWANLPGCDKFDLHELSARAQFGLWMNVQKHYTAHNTSATIELQESEIEDLSGLIYEAIQNDEGYISAALLQRFDARGGAFPRLPFEPISRQDYDILCADVEARRQLPFRTALQKHDDKRELAPQESACSSPACLANAERAEREGLT